MHSPGQRVTDDFREQIEYLADRAGEERARITEDSKPLAVKSRLRRYLWIGGLLALLEGGLLAYQSMWAGQQITHQIAAPNPLLKREDCAGERYRTSRAILAYMRQHGTAPESLDALVGTHILSRPVDPITKLPLQYRKLKNGFRLECAELAK
jgi:hypothetical protein